jgi:hypothetical protein
MALGTRGVVQIVLTCLTLATAVTAFAFAFFFEQNMDDLYENFRGPMVKHGGSEYRPCVRATLDTCSNKDHDRCNAACCPAGYDCMIASTVGLYCQERNTKCGDRRWCLDLADILQTCPTETCEYHKMVGRASTWSYILSALGVFLDLSDVITFLRFPDAIVCKSAINVFSSLVKWIAFGSVLGASTASFLSELEAASCFNPDGIALVADSGGVFLSYASLQVISAILSVTLAPFSAYWGGKLAGVPYVK